MNTRARTPSGKRAAGATTQNPKKAGGRKEASSASAAAATDPGRPGAYPLPPAPIKPHGRLAYAFYQHGGFAFCLTGVLMLWLGYGAGWMDDTRLTLLCVALNVVGLFLHETRPFSLQREVEEEREKSAQAAKAR
jgi:hypothetical protein